MSETLGSDEIKPAWTFESDSVAEKFDQHVREQLPWYDDVSQYVVDMAVSFIPKFGTVYDVGASTGNMTKLLENFLIEKQAVSISLDPSAEMTKRWNGSGKFHNIEAEWINFNHNPADVIFMFLTLMFMPKDTREQTLRHMFKSVCPGGAVFIVDKGYIDTPEIQVASKAATLAEKLRSGTESGSYVTKELSLRGEQRPTRSSTISDIAKECGFVSEEFFKFGEFYGIVCVKRSL